MLEILLNALKTFFSWFLDTVSSIGGAFLNFLLSLIPTESGSYSSVRFAVDAANSWAPIDWAISLGIIYCAFVMSFLFVKILLKLIP